MTLPWRLPRAPLHANIRDVVQPPSRHLVEVRQRTELPSGQQALLHITKISLDLPLRPGRSWLAGDRSKTVMRGESQETRVVERLTLLPTQHHHLLIVVQTGRRHPSQVLESADVLTHRRLEVHTWHPAHIGTPRIAQEVAEQVHAPPA